MATQLMMVQMVTRVQNIATEVVLTMAMVMNTETQPTANPPTTPRIKMALGILYFSTLEARMQSITERPKQTPTAIHVSVKVDATKSKKRKQATILKKFYVRAVKKILKPKRATIGPKIMSTIPIVFTNDQAASSSGSSPLTSAASEYAKKCPSFKSSSCSSSSIS